MTERDPVIRASEIGQWVYCHRAWWLARQGFENENVAALRSGQAEHARHNQRVTRALRLRLLACVLFALGILLLLSSLLIIS